MVSKRQKRRMSPVMQDFLLFWQLWGTRPGLMRLQNQAFNSITEKDSKENIKSSVTTIFSMRCQQKYLNILLKPCKCFFKLLSSRRGRNFMCAMKITFHSLSSSCSVFKVVLLLTSSFPLKSSHALSEFGAALLSLPPSPSLSTCNWSSVC